MNTTCDIFPASLLIARSSAVPVENQQSSEQARPTTAKNERAVPWEAIGAVVVLMIAMALLCLWAWSFVEFVRILVESVPQANGLSLLVQ